MTTIAIVIVCVYFIIGLSLCGINQFVIGVFMRHCPNLKFENSFFKRAFLWMLFAWPYVLVMAIKNYKKGDEMWDKVVERGEDVKFK